MLLRFLASTPVLIAAWILGPLGLFLLYRRNKRRDEEERERMFSRGGGVPAKKEAKKDRDSGLTPLPSVPAASAAPAVPMDITPGFRDLKWGDPPAKRMEVLSENGDEAIYHRPGDLLRIENVPVEDIKYVFTHGELAAVRIEAPMHVGDALLKALSARWGAPETQDPRALKQHWPHLVSGPMATAAVLEKTSVSRRTTLFVFRKAERRPA